MTNHQQQDEELRERLVDVRFNSDNGFEGTLGANMEPEYFDGLLDFITSTRNQALAEVREQMKGAIPEKVKPSRKSHISEVMSASGFNWAVDIMNRNLKSRGLM
jgi:hypothetical protein